MKVLQSPALEAQNMFQWLKEPAEKCPPAVIRKTLLSHKCARDFLKMQGATWNIGY